MRRRAGGSRPFVGSSRKISVETAIARLAEAYVEERFVSAFESSLGRQAGQLTHQPHEVNGAHLGDERIALRHVADQRADLFGFVGNVEAEDVRSAGRRLMKSEQRVNERGFAGAVGTEQTDCFATQVAAQVLQDLPATKRNA
jgi:hypothetical protein